MKHTYHDLIQQTYPFPQEGFELVDGHLSFYGIPLKELIAKYGTPFKLLFLPRIGEQIRKARTLFNQALEKYQYAGSYQYCFCTKSNHFAHVIKAALQEQVHLETSSAFDIDLVLRLFQSGDLSKNTVLVHNGYKTDAYLDKIIQLHQEGFNHSIIVLDTVSEIQRIKDKAMDLGGPIKLGIRIAMDEEPQSSYHTSRLGIRPSEIMDVYHAYIAGDSRLSLEMVHFFVDSGIKDTVYYWDAFQKAMGLFVELKRACPTVNALNLGGGFPIRNSLGFDYDYATMIDEIVHNLTLTFAEADIEAPDLYTEFGKYTVGESGAIIFSVLEQKQQNDAEKWYLVDNSLINTIPDAWSILEKFILLPINKWDQAYTKVMIGGISCDRSDYYNSEDFNQQIFLPEIGPSDEEPLYVGFFHTGAYQDAISGYGGITHCLVPSPRIIVVDKDAEGQLVDFVYRQEQTSQDMMNILGYEK